MELKAFNKDTIKIPAQFISVGKTGSGKTSYIYWLLYWLCDKVDKLFIFCPTLIDSPFPSLTVPQNVFESYDPDALAEIIENQKMAVEKAKKEGKKPPEIIILLDDASFDVVKLKDVDLLSLYTRGRHHHISIIIITQKYRQLHPGIRSNSRYTFISKIYNKAEIGALFEELGTMSRPEFEDMIKKVTQNFGVLVHDSTEQEESKQFQYDLAPSRQEIPSFYIQRESKHS
jgi:hypothetical protein